MPSDPLRHLGTLHIVVGVRTVVAFILTGQYMDRWHGHLVDYDDTTRMLYRSTHLYILYAGLLNGLLGIAWRPYVSKLAGGLRLLGSLLFLVLPVLLLLGFAYEPYMTDLARPYTRPATYMALAGGAALLTAHWLERAHS